MKPTLRQQFERLALRLNELDANLADPRVASDIKRLRELTREQSQASELIGHFRQYEQRERDVSDARAMLGGADIDADMADLAQEEINAATAEMERLHAQLQTALIPRDPDDERAAFVEIRAGTGGDESALFAADLARMYVRHCERVGWNGWCALKARAFTGVCGSSRAGTACSVCQ
jgi:peptide chain release factor 1